MVAAEKRGVNFPESENGHMSRHAVLSLSLVHLSQTRPVCTTLPDFHVSVFLSLIDCVKVC